MSCETFLVPLRHKNIIIIQKISKKKKKKFLITISTDADDFNESELSVKEALNSAIENEAQDNYESPLFDCRFSVKEISDMEQLEDKVNNTLKWLANKIACIQVYHWDKEYKKKSLNDAWQKVQEQFKEDIDWNSLTESQCKALHFGRWQSEEDIEEQISFLKSELEKGHLTKEEFDKKVANEKNTIGLRLIPLYLYPSLPIGITLTSIDGEEKVFDGKNIDTDMRFGCLAWGIKPKKD